MTDADSKNDKSGQPLTPKQAKILFALFAAGLAIIAILSLTTNQATITEPAPSPTASSGEPVVEPTPTEEPSDDPIVLPEPVQDEDLGAQGDTLLAAVSFVVGYDHTLGPDYALTGLDGYLTDACRTAVQAVISSRDASALAAEQVRRDVEISGIYDMTSRDPARDPAVNPTFRVYLDVFESRNGADMAEIAPDIWNVSLRYDGSSDRWLLDGIAPAAAS